MADKLLKSIKFPTLPDRYVIGDTSLSEEGAAAEAKAVGEALATKADTKGTYEDLIVGGAEQLMADGYETDTDPYIFRTTGGSADVGNREYLDKIVGGTVGWNQLAEIVGFQSPLNGVTFTVNSDGSVTVNGTASGNARWQGFKAPAISGHVYYSQGCPSGGSDSTYRLYSSYSGVSLDRGNGSVVKHTSSTSYPNAQAEIFISSGYTANNLVFKPQYFDLTAMFGSTIADYIYSLEQSQEGAGVAWFKKLFPEDYYPYNSSELKSVQTSAHKTYDGDGNVIGNYALDSSLTLRGVPKLVDGKLAFDGDVYPPSGEVQRRYGLVDLGTLDWTLTDGTDGYFYATISTLKNNADWIVVPNMVCEAYQTTYPNAIANKTIDKAVSAWKSGNRLIARDTSYTDATAFKAAMSGVQLVYEKAAPTTETADGYEQYQRCDPSGTEEFVTDSIVPVGHETRYPHDLKKKIETAPDSPSTDGTYLMKRSGGKNTYMALPSTPSANGSYVLTVTVSGGSASYSWTAKE